MRNWKIWPSPPADVRAFRLELLVCDVVGLPLGGVEDGGRGSAMVQVRWSGGGGRRHPVARRAVDRSFTAYSPVGPDGTASWREEFRHECKMRGADPRKGFKRWIVSLDIHGFGAITKNSSSLLGKTQIDVSEFASDPGKEGSVGIPFICSIRGFSGEAVLRVKLKFSDLTTKASAKQLAPSSSAAGLPYGGETGLPAGELVPRSFRLYSRRENGGENTMEKPPREEVPTRSTDRVRRTHSLGRFLSWSVGKFGFQSGEHPAGRRPEASGDGGTGIVYSPSASPAPEENGGRRFDEEGRSEVGRWENRALESRDGGLELVTQVFLASIDQRSEKASGEGACSVLAAVIAEWLHRNPGELPLQWQLDGLIREGSSEWRRLCEDETHLEKFSDRHFDLDTVLREKVRPLEVVTEMSYVGFLGMEAVPASLEYLRGAMSFDSLWEELLCAEAGQERVYIAGWNDHFFVLKVERAAIYLIDTLGERLFEGCRQAYILKFDEESRVYGGDEAEEASTAVGGEEEQVRPAAAGGPVESDRRGGDGKDEKILSDGAPSRRRVVCRGLAAGREFIKEFLAGVPLRELRVDMERGPVEEERLHRLLQIEFLYTRPL